MRYIVVEGFDRLFGVTLAKNVSHVGRHLYYKRESAFASPWHQHDYQGCQSMTLIVAELVPNLDTIVAYVTELAPNVGPQLLHTYRVGAQKTFALKNSMKILLCGL